MLRFAFLWLLSGCGLVLGVDPIADGAIDGRVDDGGGGAVDAGPDVSFGDADASVDANADAILPVDGGTTDAIFVDASRSAPRVTFVIFESMSRAVSELGGAGAAQLAPVRFRPGTLKIGLDDVFTASSIVISLEDRSGPVSLTATFSTPDEATHIALTILGEPLSDGYYCVHLRSTPSVRGVALDGDWLFSFPSGDGVEGGDFYYVFAVLQGDADGDGVVTDADLDLTTVGSGDPRGDVTGDGFVDGADLLLAMRTLGNAIATHTIPSVCAAFVPET